MINKEDIVNSWAFIVKADKKDLGEVKSSLKACGCKDIPSPLKGEGIITYFSNFIRNNGDVEYRKFLSDLEEMLDPSINRSFSNITVESFEDNLMSFYLQEIIKKCPEKDLPDIKAALSLTNRERTTMIKEVSMKSRTSDAFRLALPVVLSSITLGSKAILSISAALSAGLGLFLGPLAPLAIGAGVIANKVITSRSEARRKAFSIIPAVFVLIKIRREYEATIDNANDAVRYVDYLLKCNTSSNGIQSAAVQAKKDIEKKGEDDGEILSIKDIRLLAPFEWEVIQYLSSYAHEPNTSRSNTSFPVKRIKAAKDGEQTKGSPVDAETSRAYGNVLGAKYPSYTGGFQGVTKEESELLYSSQTEHLNALKREINFLSQRIEELQTSISAKNEKIETYKQILEGIRHNLAPDFEGALRPYREFVQKPDKPFPTKKVEKALRKGDSIIAVLIDAGKNEKKEYNEPQRVNLAEEIRVVFDPEDCKFHVTDDSKIPEDAYISFDKSSLHSEVLNNIKTNIEDHAFGKWSDELMPKSNRLVRIILREEDDSWVLSVENNGDPFPEHLESNAESVFKYGTSYDNLGTGIRGTGMFYISQAVLHYGGTRQFIPQKRNAFTVKYVLTFKKL